MLRVRLSTPKQSSHVLLITDQQGMGVCCFYARKLMGLGHSVTIIAKELTAAARLFYQQWPLSYPFQVQDADNTSELTAYLQSSHGYFRGQRVLLLPNIDNY